MGKDFASSFRTASKKDRTLGQQAGNPVRIMKGKNPYTICAKYHLTNISNANLAPLCILR